MEDTVGAIFDDRADFPDKLLGNEVLPTSVVQVYRYPPDPQGPPSRQRFGSLMPGSSAIPRKRPFTISVHDPLNSQNAIASVEAVDGLRSDGMLSGLKKRQRTHDARMSGALGLDQRLQSVETQAEGFPHVSQRSGTQESIHQVIDSQMSSTRKGTSTI